VQRSFDDALLVLKQHADEFLNLSMGKRSNWSDHLKQSVTMSFIMATSFHLIRFTESVLPLELNIVQLIEQSFAQATTIEQKADVLELFVDFRVRPVSKTSQSVLLVAGMILLEHRGDPQR
jgi:hypothetical protein